MKLYITAQKAIAGTILERLKLIDPYCLLAGGAPRDWFYNKPANDLDFYFVSVANTVETNRKQLQNCLGVDVNMLMERDGQVRDNELYSSMPNLKRIWECVIEGQKVQLIQMTHNGDQFKVVDNMDVSICKAYWLGFGTEVKLHKDFKLSQLSGMIFLKDGYTWDGKHAIKMKERFKNFSTGTKEMAEARLLRQTLSNFDY